MKTTRIIAICLLFGLLTFAAPPPIPRKPSTTDMKQATIQMLSARAEVFVPQPKVSPPLRLPANINPNDYVWELRRWPVGELVKVCDGDKEYHGPPGYYYLRGVPMAEWLKGLPPL